MKRFVAGLLLGLSLGAIPAWAEFGWTDTAKLEEIINQLRQINGKLELLLKK